MPLAAVQARCNFEPLRALAMQLRGRRNGAQSCPIAGCPVRLRRSHDVCPDATLAAALAAVPARVEVVWVREGEVRAEPPGEASAAAASVDYVDLT